MSWLSIGVGAAKKAATEQLKSTLLMQIAAVDLGPALERVGLSGGQLQLVEALVKHELYKIITKL